MVELIASELRGLTLHEPWCWAILHAGKTVENRPVRLPEKFEGKWVALHAGKTYDVKAAQWIRDNFAIEVPTEAQLVKGAITGLVRFSKSWRCSERTPPLSPWMFGPWCYPVVETFILKEPHGHRGMQGWWPVEPLVAAQLRDLLVEAGRAR